MTEKLSSRVERLEGPDRKVDAEIALAKGWVEYKPDWFYPPNLKVAHHRGELPYYTASLDASMSLVPEGCLWTMDSWSARGWSAGIWRPQTRSWLINSDRDRQSPTPAIALCAAALKARGL